MDLPGYGNSIDVSAETLDEYADHIVVQITDPSVLVGWSLGGLISLHVARHYPEKVSALFQVASSPKFVQDDSWPTAIEAGVFEQFAASLEKDVVKTIRRFLALQVRATETSMQTVRELQRAIDDHGLPALEALYAGLKILSDTDLTASLRELTCPVTWLLGEKDVLVPVELAEVLSTLLIHPDIHIIEAAGHAPFISHPEAFVNTLLQAVERS